MSYAQSHPLPDEEPRAKITKVSGTISNSAETPKGGRTPIKWVTVEKTMGLLPAQILAGRLESEGIRARAMQEGAGRAIGLTVGLLGEGRVYVPKEQEQEARQLIEEIQNEPIDWEGFDEEDEEV
ncbi:MAG: putative signal transducing protein [Candidatus Promineifilaceae bacterium]